MEPQSVYHLLTPGNLSPNLHRRRGWAFIVFPFQPFSDKIVHAESLIFRLCICDGCSFNQLDLPEYASKEQLQERLLLAIHEASEGFGFG
jgi:hypothetical protein